MFAISFRLKPKTFFVSLSLQTDKLLLLSCLNSCSCCYWSCHRVATKDFTPLLAAAAAAAATAGWDIIIVDQANKGVGGGGSSS